MVKERYLIGLDVGGTKCAIILGTIEGKILATLRFLTEAKLGFQNTWNNFKNNIQKILSSNNLKNTDIICIGISCGGPLDATKGIVYSPPNLPGWDAIHITEMLEKEFNIPAFLQNDAKAGALAEWKFGAGKGTKNMIFCTMGSGWGTGIIMEGKLYEGTNGMAGESGHIRLAESGPIGFNKAGSFEGFCGGNGIAHLAKIRVKKWLEEGKKVGFCASENEIDSLTAKKVAEAANARDSLAIELYQEVGKMLGRGLSVLIDIINPEVIAIGSIFARSETLLRKSMEEEIEKEAIDFSRKVVRIVPAELGESIGDYSALIIAMEGIQKTRLSNQSIRPSVQKFLDKLLQRHPELKVCEESIIKTFKTVREAFATGHRLLICGNGGSGADAEHIAGELMKGYLLQRKPAGKFAEELKAMDPSLGDYLPQHLQYSLPTIAFSGSNAFSTAFMNDVAADTLFAQQVYIYGQKGDIFIGISTSGNSPNILHAIKVSKVLGVKTIVLTGAKGGKMKSLCDIAICVPENETTFIQELHIPVYHCLCAMWEQEFFEEN